MRVYDFAMRWCGGSLGCAGAASNRLMATVKVGVDETQLRCWLPIGHLKFWHPLTI